VPAVQVRWAKHTLDPAQLPQCHGTPGACCIVRVPVPCALLLCLLSSCVQGASWQGRCALQCADCHHHHHHQHMVSQLQQLGATKAYYTQHSVQHLRVGGAVCTALLLMQVLCVRWCMLRLCMHTCAAHGQTISARSPHRRVNLPMLCCCVQLLCQPAYAFTATSKSWHALLRLHSCMHCIIQRTVKRFDKTRCCCAARTPASECASSNIHVRVWDYH
jgi:hypothetical protein